MASFDGFTIPSEFLSLTTLREEHVCAKSEIDHLSKKNIPSKMFFTSTAYFDDTVSAS